jgi:hypothetical protein
MRAIFAAVLLVATPTFAGGWASRPAGEDTSQAGGAREGLFAGVGGGGALILLDNGSGNSFGFDVEGRLGYSFNPGLQLYLSGALDSASFNSGTYRAELIGVYVQYHLISRPAVGVYARGGVGVALTSSVGPSSALGLAYAGGLGVEIAIGPGLFIAPEFFYKNSSMSISNGGGSVGEQIAGLELSLIYY